MSPTLDMDSPYLQKRGAINVQQPQLGTDVIVGCYGSIYGFKRWNGTSDASTSFNTQGICVRNCRGRSDDKTLVAASYASNCYCSDKYPPKDSKISNDKCNEPCPGDKNKDACGGLDAFTIYNTGEVVQVGYAVEASSTSSAGATPTTTQDGSTTITATPKATSAPPPQQNNNMTGVIAGAVVGVLALLAIIGVAFCVMRRRRNSQIEEEHRRNAAVNSFINGGKPGSSSGMSIGDQRLDLSAMANRRMSDGSIADNEDYSRRILRVTNA